MSHTTRQILSERVQAELERSGLGKSRFALMLGISRMQLENILKCKTDAKLSTIDKIAAAVGCEPWELIKAEQEHTDAC